MACTCVDGEGNKTDVCWGYCQGSKNIFTQGKQIRKSDIEADIEFLFANMLEELKLHMTFVSNNNMRDDYQEGFNKGFTLGYQKGLHALDKMRETATEEREDSTNN